jgi:hypothetical protein
MSYSQWSNFVYYRLGDIAMLGSITYQALQANINVSPSLLAPNWQVLPAPAGAGVSSLSTLTGAITQSCSAGTYTTAGNDIALTIAFPAPPLVAINGLTGSPAIGTLARSSIQVQTISPNIQVGLNSTAFGVYVEATGGAMSVSIASALCVPTSVIQLTYIHTGGGGGSQYIKDIVAGTGSFVITCNTAIDIGDEINWLVLNA